MQKACDVFLVVSACTSTSVYLYFDWQKGETNEFDID